MNVTIPRTELRSIIQDAGTDANLPSDLIDKLAATADTTEHIAFGRMTEKLPDGSECGCPMVTAGLYAVGNDFSDRFTDDRLQSFVPGNWMTIGSAFMRAFDRAIIDRYTDDGFDAGVIEVGVIEVVA